MQTLLALTVAKKLEAVVRKYPDVETVFTTVGSRGGEPNKGNLYVKLKKDRQLKTAQLQDQLRQTLPKIPGVNTSVEDIQFVDTGGDKPLQVALRGNDLATLSSVSKKIKERIINLPGFADVTVTGDGNPRNQVLQIERLNQQRVVYISANLGGNLTLGDATDRIVTEAKSLLPAGVTLDLGGDSARQNEVVGSFVSTLLLSALCIILVLVLLFKSWVDSFYIYLKYFFKISFVGTHCIANMRNACAVNQYIYRANLFKYFIRGFLIGNINSFCNGRSFLLFNFYNSL